MLLEMRDPKMLSKSDARGLLGYLEALRGGEEYLRTVALRLAQEKGNGTTAKDSGIRRVLSDDTVKNLANLKALASRLEYDFGLSKGILERASLAFHDRFQSLVRTWIACRPDGKKWREQFPDCWAAAHCAATEMRLQLFGFEDGLRLDWRFNDDPETPAKNAESAAVRRFLQFATDPLQNRLRCCRRCQEFFIVGRSDQLSCTVRCATALTAKEANRRRRETERNRQLARLRSAMKKLAFGKKAPADWKNRVARSAGLSRTFVTRAVTRGDIKAPATLASARQKTGF